MNALQADGPTAGVLRIEPAEEVGVVRVGHTQRIDGNDPAALVDAFDAIDAREPDGMPM